MYIRKKKNPSGVISVQIIDKSSGKYTVLKTIGSSSDSIELDQLDNKAKMFISEQKGQLKLDFSESNDLFETFIQSISSIQTLGTSLVLEKIFNTIGFNKIEDDLFRILSIYRVVYPFSKLKMVDYLQRFEHLYLDEDAIYRYMDKLNTDSLKQKIQAISFKHSIGVLGESVKAVFYDVTTLYFEIKEEDALRKAGFNKDGKHHCPQIVLGLLVSQNGYPLAYEIFDGKTFEGKTMLPILKAFKKKYNIKEITVVADAGLLSNENMQNLEKNKFGYLLGARIKNMNADVQKSIFNLKLKNGESSTIQINDRQKLVINYSEARAKKDSHNRKKGVEKLEVKIKTGKLNKEHINNKGYNKFLKIKNRVDIELDKSSIKKDEKWDGLKGYITNTQLGIEQILSQYNNLWKIERAFRINKTELKVRPIYHRIAGRIKAHISLCFVAYKLYMELERKLKEQKVNYSVEKFIGIAKSIYCIEYKNPITKEACKKVMYLSDEHQVVRSFLELF